MNAAITSLKGASTRLSPRSIAFAAAAALPTSRLLSAAGGADQVDDANVAPKVQRVDYRNVDDAKALVFLLESYARDPMGGGTKLNSDAADRLCGDLASIPGAISFIVWHNNNDHREPVGLINCFEGYSTFNARPLLNVHDIAVLERYRGQGVGRSLLMAAEEHARSRGCCKLTLEVLSGNAPALATYERFGFRQYELDPACGHAQFMHKKLL
jgi:ribosomal protein S18 acetylase RimI-like enzyme